MLAEKRCSLRLKLVEDLPGEHVYIHACRNCGREYGEEFVVYHASTGKTNGTAPIVAAPICSAPWPRGFDLSLRIEVVSGGLGLVGANA